jgi:transcriptional regulator with XRE-family HTH domain
VSFAQRLRAARCALGLSQDEVSFRAGVMQKQWSAYECGRCEPNLTTLRRMAPVLMLDNEAVGRLVVGETGPRERRRAAG